MNEESPEHFARRNGKSLASDMTLREAMAMHLAAGMHAGARVNSHEVNRIAVEYADDLLLELAKNRT